MGHPIEISWLITADQEDLGETYIEFKRRVRIPHCCAEAIYQSADLHHFYTLEARV